MTTVKARRQPSQYPSLPFHIIRTAQLVSSLIVLAQLAFFIWHLTRDQKVVPWTFLVLMAVSLLTITSILITFVLYFCRGLNPGVNLVANTALGVLWALGFALLSWWASSTIAHGCNVHNWENEAGIMVCRLYKALFTFGLLGFVSTVSAVILDLVVRRGQVKRGLYNQMQDFDRKKNHSSQDEPWSVVLPRSKGDISQGYELPGEQFNYDTGYTGGHESRL